MHQIFQDAFEKIAFVSLVTRLGTNMGRNVLKGAGNVLNKLTTTVNKSTGKRTLSMGKTMNLGFGALTAADYAGQASQKANRIRGIGNY